MKTFICLLLLTTPAFAFPKHAPLPPEVDLAKTVYIVNQTGDQNISDSAYEAFSKWGRFSVTTNKSKADLLVTFVRGNRMVDGTLMIRIEMLVSLSTSEDAFYQISDDGMGLHLQSTRGPIAAKNCVFDFKKRIEGH